MAKKKEAVELPISITEFGRRKGVSHTAVANAIASGRLVKSVVVLKNGRRGVMPTLADKEWVENTDTTHWRSRYSVNGGSNAEEVDPEQTKASSSAGLNAAKKAKAIYDAKLAELEYKKKSGVLVEKKKVYESLFDFGKELRNELLALPDRVIDDILAAPSRNESLTVLYDGLAKVLEQLTKLEHREIAAER